MTGMSPSAQAYAEGAVTRTIKSLESKRRPELQAGMVLTDVHNGDVLAVIGSREVSEVGFNRAIEAQRPVGSLLKPSAAAATGTPATRTTAATARCA
ncbi:hypothetical protein G6F23_014788 [Rhizopus arrhizus]|nr:hypothetical protein G6F23_014788 [Rhizopus arrhizus]